MSTVTSSRKRDITSIELRPYQRALLDRAAEQLHLPTGEILRRALEKYVAAVIALERVERLAAEYEYEREHEE